MPDANRPITPDEFLLEALVRGKDVLTIAQRRFGWSVTNVLDWFDQPWVQMHITGARELEEVRFDFTLARVRGAVAQRLAELALTEGVALETQRKAAEEVTRIARARDRRARNAAEKPVPRREPTPHKATLPPPPETPTPEAQTPEVSTPVVQTPEAPVGTIVAEPPRPEVTAPATSAPLVEKGTVASDDAPRGQDEAPAAVRGVLSIDRDVCPTGEPRADERRELVGPGGHGRGRSRVSGWKKPRAAVFDEAMFVGGAAAGRGVTGLGGPGLREGPAQKSRPPPTPRR